MQEVIQDLRDPPSATGGPCEPPMALERIAREVATAVLERQGIHRVLVLKQSDFLRIVQELAASRSADRSPDPKGWSGDASAEAPLYLEEGIPRERAAFPRSEPRSERPARTPRTELLRQMFRRDLEALQAPASQAA